MNEIEFNNNEKLINKINRIRIKIEALKIKKEKLEAKESKDFLQENRLDSITKKIEYLENSITIYETSTKEEARIKLSLLREKNRRHEILYGNLVKTIIAVCFPIAIYNFFNSFYSLIDSVMCSNISASSVNNVAILSQVKNTISAFGAGVAGGGAILVSRYYGAGKIDKAKKSAGNILLISLIVSVILCLIMIPFASLILRMVDVSSANHTTIYFQLQIFELALVSINTVFIGLEKVKGNSKKIFYLNLIVLAVKLILNCIFIYQIEVSNIVWIEISTIIAQAVLFSIAIITFFSPKNALRIKGTDLKPERKYIVPILKLSIPIFFGKFVMSFGKVIVNKMCSTYYNTVTNGLIAGALSVSNNLSGLITSPTNAFEEGESTIVSQNLGNKNIKRSIECFLKTLIIVMTISIVGYICVRFIFIDNLIQLFSSNKKENTEESAIFIKYIKEVFKYDSLSIISLGLTSGVLGLLYGYGKTFLSSILNFSRIATRILTLYILHECGVGYKACGIAMGISNIIIGILALVSLLVFFITFNKNKQKILCLTEEKPKNKEIA